MATANINFSVLFSGSGSGVVTSSPAGITCPGTCVATLVLSGSAPNFPATFTAVPNPGSVFGGWSMSQAPLGAPIVSPLSSSNATETFIIGNVDSQYTLTALFNRAPQCDPVTLVDNGPFNLIVGDPFGPVTLIPVGGTGPYTFGIDPNYPCTDPACPVPATLPPGVTLGATTGILQGTPTGVAPCPFIPITVSYTLPGQGPCTSTICIQMVVTTRPVNPICYYLIPCVEGRPNVILVTNDLSSYVGQVIQILGVCYTVQVASTCEGSVTLNNPVITTFADCCSCNPPKVFELIDCSLQNQAIFTTTDLSFYVGKTVKICNFTASPVIPINGTAITCTAPNEKGFVTQITGPTTGSYYESSSGLIKPYLNNIAFPLSIGDEICVNPVSPFNVVSFQTGLFTIQFFIGTTPITTPIIINTVMPIPTVQYFIDQAIIFPNTTITVNTFDTFNHLNVTVNITGAITETELNVIVTPITNPTYPPTTTVTEDILGSCVCYTVSDAGTSCATFPPFTYTIDSFYDDCVCCDPPPVPEPPQYVPTPPEIDKHTYKIPESQCDIDVKKEFAAAMYDVFKQKQYGVESCCNINPDAAWIKNSLSDLSKIKC